MNGATPPSRKLRVLTLTDSVRALGGAERLAVRVTTNLDPSRFERMLCLTRHSAEPTLLPELREAAVELLLLDRETKADVLAWRQLVSLVRRRHVDVIHAHQFGSNVWGTVLGRLAGVPVVVAHEHTWSFEGQPLRRFLDREVVSRYADAFIAVSKEDRRKMLEVERVDASRVRVIPNGIPPFPTQSADVRAEVRAELGIPEDAPVIGTVSVLRPQKALSVLIRAAALLATEFRDLHVLIVGDGPERDVLPALIRERGLEETVRLLGVRSDVPRILAALDLTVLSSDYEGSPLAVMEYMAAGKPVVATRVGGLPDMVEDGVEGLLVERRSPQELAGAVAALLRDPARRDEMGARARERQRRDFDFGAMVRRVETLYEGLFAATDRARAEGWSAVA